MIIRVTKSDWEGGANRVARAFVLTAIGVGIFWSVRAMALWILRRKP